MARTSLSPGFRFHPTDVELVKYYLKRKLMGKRFLFDAVSELNIYKYSPWDLPDKSCLRSKDLEWYFFCPNERKYASGARTNRATESGFWKSTGKDRPVIYNKQTVGMVKTLVFHRGHAPKGERTDWVMYEYRIQDKELADAGIVQDAYVLCKVFQKSGPGPKANAHYGAPFNEEEWEDDDTEFCGLSLQSNSLPSPALLYDKNTSVGNTCRGPLSMPGPSNILPSADEVPPLPMPCPSPILPSAVEVLPLLEIDDFISLSDILKEDGSLLLDHNVHNEVEENFSQEKNAEAFTGKDGNEIYSNLEDLDNWPDLGGGGFKVSGNQTTGYGVFPVLGGGHEEFLELNDLNVPLNFPSESTISTDFLSATSCKPYYNDHWDQDYFLVNSFGAVHNVSSMNELPPLPEGSNGHDNRSLGYQENGNRGSANLGFTATSRVENRGTQQRKPYSRLQQLLESIPAHHASAAELFAPANEAERSDKTIVFPIYGGSSIHVKAEVTRRGGACTKDALLGESPYSYCGCNLSMTGSGKKVVKFGSSMQSFFFLAVISTLFWVVLVEIIITTLGRHAWNFVSS